MSQHRIKLAPSFDSPSLKELRGTKQVSLCFDCRGEPRASSLGGPHPSTGRSDPDIAENESDFFSVLCAQKPFSPFDRAIHLRKQDGN